MPPLTLAVCEATSPVETNQTAYLVFTVFKLGVLTNMTTPTLKVVDPVNNTTTTTTVTQGVNNTPGANTGQYYATLTPTKVGLWRYVLYDGTANLGSGEFAVLAASA